MEPQTRRRQPGQISGSFLCGLALAALLVMLFGVVFGLYIQPDAAMHPHLKPGDLLLFYRLPRSCTAGEVVVFTKDGQRRTGRVAARGGDTVEVTTRRRLSSTAARWRSLISTKKRRNMTAT
ncbi:MAG: S26 family signal peptidase [Gemmiger formicilis]|uniref:S26 family signal peptidase n=1 Tax=Gemmiger formicilis TaxID=745368 RepID=UPI0039958420